MGVDYGDTILCDLGIPGDIDTFEFGGASGEKIVVQVAMASAQPHVELRRSDGTLVDSDTGLNGADQTARMNVELTSGGTFRIFVSEAQNDATDTYALALERVAPPSDPAIPICLGCDRQESIGAAGELDLFEFSATAGEVIAAQVVMSSGQPALEVWGPDGTLVDSDAGVNIADHDARVVVMVPVTGIFSVLTKDALDDKLDDYTLALERVSDCLSPADIDLSGQSIGVDEVFQTCGAITAGPDFHVHAPAEVVLVARGPITLIGDASVETGATLAASSPDSETICKGCDLRRRIDPLGETDLFEFSGVSGETYVAQAVMTTGGPRVEIYDPDGTSIAVDSSINGADHDARVNVVLSKTGNHRILVKEARDSNVDDVTVAFERVSPPSPSAVELCPGCTLPGDLEVIGALNLFKISAAGTELVSVQAVMPVGGPALDLFDPNGVLVASDASINAADHDAQIEVSLTEAGAYSLLVREARNSQTDTYTVSLQCLGGC